MTKDEQIAELRADKEFLKERVRNLEIALELATRVPDPTPGALRQRRYRERNARRNGVTGGLIGGEPSPSQEGDEDVTPEAKDREETQGLGKGCRGKPGDAETSQRDAEWLAFREAYPRTDRTSWLVAERRFRALSKADRAAALDGVRRYHPKPEYEKGAQSWISERRWETVDDAPSKADKHAPDYSGIEQFGRYLEQQGVA